MNEGRKDYCWKNEGEEDGRERENPNWKNLHAVQKGECGENNGWDLSKKCPKRGEIQDEARKNRISGLKK